MGIKLSTSKVNQPSNVLQDMNILTPKLKKRRVYFEIFSSGQQDQQRQQQQQQQDPQQQQQQQQQDPAGKQCLRPHMYDDTNAWGKMLNKKTSISQPLNEISKALEIQLKEAASDGWCILKVFHYLLRNFLLDFPQPEPSFLYSFGLLLPLCP